jgi:putative hydrolase of the HAD superfamily
MEKFRLKPYLDIQLSSCYLGMRKPDADIYRRALDIVGCAPGRVVFIDDRAENANAAAAQGMHAIQFTGEEALRTTLKELAIL